MPIYAYKCASCGHVLDALQKLSDPPRVECPACGEPALVKQVTAAGFQLKGSGWYATDFRNNGAAPAKKDEASSEQPSDKAAAEKGDKPADKADKPADKADKPAVKTEAPPAKAPAPSPPPSADAA